MKGTATLIKPIHQRSKSAISHNMFKNEDEVEELPSASRENH